MLESGGGSPLVFWIFRFFLLGMLIYAGYGISYKGEQNFRKYAWMAAIPYALIEGLRWLRGADYAHYYNDLVTGCGAGSFNKTLLGGTLTYEPEFLYDMWTKAVYYLHIPFWIVFIFYSAILIYALLKILKHFPQAAVYALPIFFIVTVNSSENVIRQFLATAFLLLAYAFYLEGKPLKMWIMIVVVPFIHFSGLFAEAILLFGVYVPKIKIFNKLLNMSPFLWLIMATYVVTYFFWDSGLFDHFASFLSNNVDLGDEKGAGYVENADRWFTEEGSISYVLYGAAAGSIGLLNNIVQFLTFSAILWFGFYAAKENPQLAVCYYFTIAACLMMNISGDIELFRRFYLWFVPFMPIVSGVVIAKIRQEQDLIMKWIVLAPIFLYFVYYGFVRSIGAVYENGYAFIWDANVPLF